MIDERLRKTVEAMSDEGLEQAYYSMDERDRAIAIEYFYRLITRMD